MNKNIFFATIIVILLYTGCNNINNRKMAVLSLRELPNFVQDTLRKLPVDEYGCYPDLIDFTNKFHYRSTTIGPWQHEQILTDSINQVSYSFSYDTPRPFIVTSTFIAFPMTYVNSLKEFHSDTLSFRVVYIER